MRLCKSLPQVNTIHSAHDFMAFHSGPERERPDQKLKVKWKILDARSTTVATAESAQQVIEEDGSATVQASAKLAHSELWSVDIPNLCSAAVTVEEEGKFWMGSESRSASAR